MSEENNAATPGANNGGTPPAQQPATPAKTEGFVLTFKTKEEMENFQRDAARAPTLQSKADRWDRYVGKNGGHFKPATPATPPTPEELAAHGAEEDKKAERGLLAIAADPTFREVFDADPTLRDLFTKNPLAVLPIYANDALDADDALDLVKDALTKLKKPATPPTTPPATPPTPPAGGVNPNDKAVDEEYEKARKNPNTETALAGMIKSKMKKAGGKQ